MNVLAIGCHPDDLEIGCGGTLRKYAEQGAAVYLCHIANGDQGHVIIPPPELAAIRAKEAETSGRLLGARQIFDLQVSDLQVNRHDQAVLDAVADVVRITKPDVILTHNPTDYNPDHELTSKIVKDIAVMIPIAKLPTKSAPYDVIPSIWYFEPVSSMGFIPTDYVDITDYYETKKKMLSCHESQRAWMSDNFAALRDDQDKFFDTIRITSEFRGMQAGCKYAEGFVRAMDGFRTRMTERVLP